MDDTEKGPFGEEIARAVEVGDPKEVEALSLRAEHVEWIRKQAFKDARELVKSEAGWPAWRILVHTQALVGRLERQLRVAKADRNSLRRRIAELESRHAELQLHGLSYRGVWEDGSSYRPGELATFRGALWHCWKFTLDKPGTSDAWQLTHKTHARDER